MRIIKLTPKRKPRTLILFILGLILATSCGKKDQPAGDSFMQVPDLSEFQDPAYPAPKWLRDAVFMEIPIRTFNHPDYNNPQDWENECGNASYTSIIEKLPFLKDFGINVICLYTIYHHTPGTNLYAIRHHEADPTLGTVEDIKTLIKEAHKLNIKVISNTNYYGVDQTSPMINEHPDWFIEKKYNLYGQRVFDLNNPEVVKYIIDTHIWWCTEVGLDGWRIDIAHETYRKYIWDPILETCYANGKQILLATEGAHLDSHLRGAGWGRIPVSLDMEYPQASWKTRKARYGSMKDYLNPTSEDPYAVKDISNHNSTVPCPHNYYPDTCSREGAYQVKGSRFLYGHNLMFAPFVPWMMHGEIFNATHLGVPGVMFHRLRGKLLHSYLDWDDLDEQENIMEDFKKISHIRNEHKDLFHNNRHETHLLNIPYTAVPQINAKPYARFIPGKKAVIVVGNNDTTQSATFQLQIPLNDLGFGQRSELVVTDLWTGNTKPIRAELLSDYSIIIPRDKSPGGGVRVILLE